MVRSDPHMIVPGAAQGYTMDSAGYKLSGDLFASYGAGGIYTTIEDLGRGHAYEGKYRLAVIGFEMAFWLEDGVLVFSSEGQPDVKMIFLKRAYLKIRVLLCFCALFQTIRKHFQKSIAFVIIQLIKIHTKINCLIICCLVVFVIFF